MISGAADDRFVDTVDEIAAALRQHPVLVQDVMGNGHTAEVEAALTSLVEQAGIPVYVVLSVTPTDLRGPQPDKDLVHVLHARLGDGVYVVRTLDGSSREVGVFGHDLVSHDADAAALSNAASDAGRQVELALDDPDFDLGLSAAAQAALVVDMLKRDLDDLPEARRNEDGVLVSGILSPAEVAEWSTETWTTASQRHVEWGERPDPDLDLVVGVAAALTTAAVGYRLLQALSGTVAARRARRTAPGSTESLRARARSEVSALDARLAGLPVGDTAQMLDAREAAGECLAAGESLLSGDRLDVVAALVLARTGERALDRPGDPAYTCCFLNPLHGEGTARGTLGGREDVPVCPDCATALTRAKVTLDPLLEERLGRDRPYYAGDGRWAETGFGALDPARFRRTAGAVR